MNIELTQPIYLWGILLTGLLILIWRRSLVIFVSSRRHCITLIVRLLLVLTLLLTLAGTTLWIRSNQQTIVFLLDHSLSIDDLARQQGKDFIKDALIFASNNDLVSLHETGDSSQNKLSSDTHHISPRFSSIQSSSISSGNSPNTLTDFSSYDSFDTSLDLSNKHSWTAVLRKFFDRDFKDNPQTNWLQMEFATTVRGTQSAKDKNATIPESDQSIPFFSHDSTNISEALELAAAQISSERVGKIILLSDGNENRGDALTTAGKLGIPISTVLLSGRKSPEVQMAKLSAPENIRQGAPFFLEIMIRSNQEKEAKISLYRGPFKILEESRSLRMGENHFLFQQTAGKEGKVIYSAVVDCPTDTLLNNNKISQVITIGNRPRILLIDNEPESVASFISLLKKQDFDIELRSIAEMPNTLNDLNQYDLLFLSNIASNAFSRQQEKILKLYINELGGGLIASGGDHAFQSISPDNIIDHNVNPFSSDENDPDHNINIRSEKLATSKTGNNSVIGNTMDSGVFSDLLPIRNYPLIEKTPQKKALVLLIDRSGSMAGKKLEMSKEAALLTARHLTTKDYLSVIAFDSQAQTVISVQNIDSLSLLDRKIESMIAAGGTKFTPALIMAQKELLKTDALHKHIVLLTDGQSEENHCEELVKKISSQNISLSTVGIGDSADNELLRLLARWGNGRHYICSDPAMIPKILLKESDLSDNTPFVEEPFLPHKYFGYNKEESVKSVMDNSNRSVAVDHSQNETDRNITNDLLSGIDFELVPPLLGYVKTKSKPTATTILTMENEEPLLVCWRYGLGQVIAFTSDVKSRWGAEWLVWSEAPAFWGQIIRHSLKRDVTGNFPVQMIRRDNTFVFILEARNKNNDFINEAEGILTVIAPDLSEKKISLKQIAPGSYSAEFDLIPSGIFHLHWLLCKNNETLVSQSQEFIKSYSDELQLQAPNGDFMKRIADLSGGYFNPTAQSIFSPNDRTSWQAIPLWPWLLTFALFLYLLDVYLRRTEQNRINVYSDRSKELSTADNIFVPGDNINNRKKFFQVIISIVFQRRSK